MLARGPAVGNRCGAARTMILTLRLTARLPFHQRPESRILPEARKVRIDLQPTGSHKSRQPQEHVRQRDRPIVFATQREQFGQLQRYPGAHEVILTNRERRIGTVALRNGGATVPAQRAGELQANSQVLFAWQRFESFTNGTNGRIGQRDLGVRVVSQPRVE